MIERICDEDAMRGCCVKNDERRVERSSGRNDGHAGRLIRKLALVFLAFAVVAVVLNCALAYVSTRDTFLQSEAYRLGQVGGYAANATPQALPSDALQAWKDNADELDPATTYDQSLAETQGLISAYNAEVDRLKGSEEEATEEDQDRLDGMLAEYERKSIPLSLYSLDAMLDRLRASFSVSRLMLRCVTPASRSGRATSLSRLPFVVTQSSSTPGISDNMRQKSTAPRRTSGSPPVTRIFLTPQRTAAAAISRSSSSEQKSPCARFSTPSSGMQ